VGAVDDIHATNDFNQTPLYASCKKGHHDMTIWLTTVGAANDMLAAELLTTMARLH